MVSPALKPPVFDLTFSLGITYESFSLEVSLLSGFHRGSGNRS